MRHSKQGYPWLTFFKIVLFIGCYTSGQAQDNLRYQGPLAVGNYAGDANYGYKLSQGDTLLNGSFELKKANLDSLLQKQDYTFNFSGNFNNDYPSGFWKFQFGTFQSNNTSQVIDYQYRVAINGEQEEASGNIVKGKPDGQWVYVVNGIEDSKVTQVRFKSSINFNNGVPQQSFRIENDSLTLIGRFLRNGLAHDEWSLFTSLGFGAAENWNFNDGVLDQIELEVDGKTESIPIYQNLPAQTKTVHLDSRYINAITLWLSLEKKPKPIGGKMQRLLTQNAGYYKKIDGILSKLGKSSFLPEFKVKVPYYPYSDAEKKYLDSIQNQFSVAKEISESFIESTQLNILKLADAEASMLYDLIETITATYLNPIEALLSHYDKALLEFVPRNKLISNLWPNGKPNKAISPIGSSQLYEDSQFDFSENNLKTVAHIITHAEKNLVEIQQILLQKLTKEQRQQELIRVEEQLIAQREALQQLVDSADSNGIPAYNKALDKVLNIGKTKLSDYSAIKDISVKLSTANQLLTCNEQLHLLAKAITKLPEQDSIIRQKYQDRVWNPFMATLMDEEVKKRITSAYRKVLVPYFLEQINSDIACEEVGQLNSLITATYQRMLELRLENTSKLERKLRKTNKASIVLELFGLTSTTNQQ